MLGLTYLVALLDDGLGGLSIDTHVGYYLLVRFNLRVEGMLDAHQSVRGYGAHVACYFCELVLNPAFFTPPTKHIDQRVFVVGQTMSLLLLGLEDTCLWDGTEEEVEGVTGGDIVFCEGCKDDCFIEHLAKDIEPISRVPQCLHRLSALFELCFVAHTIVYFLLTQLKALPALPLLGF